VPVAKKAKRKGEELHAGRYREEEMARRFESDSRATCLEESFV